MSDWKPIEDAEFLALFENQYQELDRHQREVFELYRVPFWRATIRRSDEYGDEKVFVVSQAGDGVLYFDDVEFGFNIATVDEHGRIVTPGGSQATLAEAIDTWFPKQ